MNRLLYNILLHAMVAPLLVGYYLPSIVFGNKYRRSLGGKLGRLPADFLPERLTRPRIWFHAVSVGEVVALGPLVAAVKRLLPDAAVVVSTGTETGQDKARSVIPQADGFFYLPLDFPECIVPVVARIRPDLFVLMETELWPNLIHCLKRRGTVIALANGRISDRSFPRYRKLRWFFSPVLRQIDLLLMSSELDAHRITEMGAREASVRVTGNTKFDAMPADVMVDAEPRMREILHLHGCHRIWVAGSTHPGEHEIVLDAYRTLAERFPDLILVLVPRHVEKTPSILSAMEARGMERPFLRSSANEGETRNGRQVVIVDCTGELFQIYSLASVVFVGGSLVPRGGQNILEPAAWGKVVTFGPSMEDFRDARDILVRTGAGIEVRGQDDLMEFVSQALADPQRTNDLGARGREAILKHVGSARRNAEILVACVQGISNSAR
jgi:3-deoxy-D-manno-octulosonic-acid transferase